MAKTALEQFAPPTWWEQFQSYQGLYVVGADGTCYDYQVVWKLPPENYLGILDLALAKFVAKGPKPVEIADSSVKEAAPAAPDPSTSVLRVFSRIRPVPKGCDKSNEGIGRDHMWIFEDEVRELVQAAEQADEKPFPLPNRIAYRLVRFHLLDTTRNVSPTFSEQDIAGADFTVRRVSDSQRFVFQGVYDSTAESEEGGKQFGIAGWLQGKFEVDTRRDKIDRFRAYGEATASGANNAGAPEDDYSVVFAIVEAYDDISKVVPPLYYDISPVWRPIYRDPQLPHQVDR